MKTDCDACQGIESLTPETVANRPGLPALRYRAGTHGSILSSMIAQLSVFGAERAKTEAERQAPARRSGQPVPPPSTWLRSRELSDPTLALLDAWSTVGDILTFYQERIANEGYLPTARELRSLHELASQVGYRLRPALSSSVYLAFDVQAPPALDLDVPPAPPHEVLIPKGTQARHIPGPGELPQVFETREDLVGRPEWNLLRPRLTKPTVIDAASSRNLNKLRFERIDLGLQPGDLLLLVCKKPTSNASGTTAIDTPQRTVRRIKAVTIDSKRQQTIVDLIDSPFSLVAYRDTIARAASVYQAEWSLTSFDSSLTLLGPVATQWTTAVDKIFTAASNEKLTLLKTDDEAFNAFKQLYEPGKATPNWAVNDDAYQNVCNQVDVIAAGLRKSLIDLFVSLNADGQPAGWGATFAALLKVRTTLVHIGQVKGYNEIVRHVYANVDKTWTVKDVLDAVTVLKTKSDSLDTQNVEGKARAAMKALEAALTEAVKDVAEDKKLTDGQVTAIKTAVSSKFGKPYVPDDVAALIDKWNSWIFAPQNSSPLSWMSQSPWANPGDSIDTEERWKDAATLGDTIADSQSDQSTAIGISVDQAFLKALTDKRGEVIQTIKGVVDRLSNIGDSSTNEVTGVEKSDTDELLQMARKYDPKTLTTCVSDTFALLKTLDSSDLLTLKKNRTKVAAHLAAAQTALRGWEQAPNPAAAASVSILEEIKSQLPETDNAHVFLKKVVTQINGYKPESQRVSRLAFVRHNLLLVDKDNKLDVDQLTQNLQSSTSNDPNITGDSLKLLVSRLVELDEALKTPAHEAARSAFRIGGGLGEAGGLLSFLQQSSTGQANEKSSLQGDGDIIARLMSAMRVPGADQLISAIGKLGDRIDAGQVFSFATRSGLFGATAPQGAKVTDAGGNITSRVFDPTYQPADDEKEDVLYLEQEVAGVSGDGWCLVGQLLKAKKEDAILPFGSEGLFHPYQVKDATRLQRNAYEQTGKSTRLLLDNKWITKLDELPSKLRSTIVLAASRELTVADELLEGAYPELLNGELELDEFSADLETKRIILISGEVLIEPEGNRTFPVQTGSKSTHQCELVSAVSEFDDLGRIKTKLIITPILNVRFVRDTVRIYANVVEATNGSTVEEVIGNGEGQGAFQRFLLAQPRLTYLPAETASGMKPEIEVRVNSVKWELGESIAELRPVVVPGRTVGGVPQRTALPLKYLAAVDDAEKTFLTTGDGITTGERLPTGITNVRAIYRVGGGRGGNVGEGTITQLASPPLNVTKVRNLMAASGGVDREDVDQARKNVPLAVMALDRLVSVVDYESFVRKFAGIAKAQAKVLSINGQNTVVVTIAGLDDIPVVRDSLLYRNLVTTVKKFADPEQAVLIEPRELLLLLTQARIKVEDNHLFEVVKEEVRQRILKRFTFERAELGESVLLSDLIETIQNTPGVRYVDVDMFDRMRQFYGTAQMVAHATKITEGIAQSITPSPRQQPQDYIVAQRARENADLEGHLPQPAAGAKDERVVDKPQGFTCLPAQLAYFADLAGTILLKEIK